MYPGYELVHIFNIPLKINGQQVYYHAGRDAHSIERDHKEDDQSHLAPLIEDEQAILDHSLAWEKAEMDAQEGLNDAGKEAGQ